MNTVFNKTKVKSWIKKAYRDKSLAYGHGYITDGYVMLVDEPHMQPTILEVYGTLTPECKYSAEQFQKLTTLPDEPVEMFDSELEYAPYAKHRLRIFYDPMTGKNLAIRGEYFDLLDDPRLYRFCTNEEMSTMWIIYNDDIVGVVAPFMLQDQLSHISFKVENEAEDCIAVAVTPNAE